MKILSVDDNPSNLLLLDALLTKNGHSVVSARNGVEAMNALERTAGGPGGPFDLIVTDILMPEMDGFQFCREVKTNARFRKIPVIVYTATYTSRQDELLALSLGASRFLLKPAEPDHFMGIVEELLGETARRSHLAAGDSESGGPESEAPADDTYLRVYNQRLVHKLEHKVEQLEAASRELQALIAERDREIARRTEAETVRWRYQEELERSQQRYRSFVEHSSESIWRVDLDVPLELTLMEEAQVDHILRHGRFEECNQATAEHLGLDSPAQLIGRTLGSVFSGEPARRNEELLEVIRQGGSIKEQETRYLQQDGSYRWFCRSLVGIREGGGIVRFWGVSRDITAQKVLEQQIRALSARRQELLEQERARISREIHDDLGQQLSALKMLIASGSGRLGATEEAVGLVDAAIASTRRIATDLRPPELDHFGLPAAIESHVHELARTTGLAFDCDVQENITTSPDLALAIFRILQESLTNVLRHANARKVMITLMEDDSDLILTVADDGRGMSREGGRRRFGGLGLAGMRERAAAYSGELVLVSELGRGTSIEARFPVAHLRAKHAGA